MDNKNETVPTKEGPAKEEYLTLKGAAKALGLPYFKLQRAARQGIVPTYRFLNGRALVLLSEIETIIRTSRSGGSQ